MQTSSVFKQKGKKNTLSSEPDKNTPVSPGLKKEACVPMFLRRTAAPTIQSKFDEDAQLRRKVLDPAEEEVLEDTDTSQVQRQVDKEIEVSPSLEVGSPDDAYEQEADQVADQVMRMPDTQTPQLQGEEDDLKNAPSIQAKSAGPPSLSGKSAQTVQSPGIGNPLPVSVRSKVEPVLGNDLSHVRVHDDASASKAAGSIQAKAFTHRKDVFLGKGQSAHDTSLMAHELTHVVQQTGRGYSDKPGASMTGAGQKSSDLSTKNTLQRKATSGVDYTWLEDVTLQGPKGSKYRFRLYETTQGQVKSIAAMKNCHGLQPGSAEKFSKLFGLGNEKYAPLNKPGRFYSLYHLDSGPYLSIETFLGNLERLKERSLESMLPKEIGVLDFSLSFDIPGNVQLTDDWNDVSTTTQTSAIITVSSSGIRLRFYPGLLIDAQYPASDMIWSGLHYDFKTASITSIDLKNSQWWAPFDEKSTARGIIKSLFYSLISLTRLKIPGYNPLTDPHIDITLKALKKRLMAVAAKQKKGSDIKVKNISASVSAWVKKEINQSTQQGGVKIPAGSMLTIEAAFSGGVDEIAEKSTRKIRTITLSSVDDRDNKGIIVLKDGSPVAKLQRVYISNGGKVTLGEFSLAGSAAKMGGVESLIKLLFVGTGEVRTIAPTGTRGLVEKELEQALTNAVIKFIQENHDVIPGVDLCEIMGVSRPGGAAQ